ncbi:hypothetical protein E3N88_27199 [Mikania micrantha]|uniref:Uncharacterized protein n=1 Tax=Mikania micrantha TaxID=192012 RepID=A0A5N6MW56_9ASTR|nr:hypothetical protein E3N88_27199 [Mikania micrantha]
MYAQTRQAPAPYKGLYITFVNTQTYHDQLLASGGMLGLEDAPGFWFKTVPPDGVANLFDCFQDLVAQLEVPASIICDGFLTFAKTIQAAEKLNVPIFLFWPMAACGFMGCYQVKVLTDKEILPLKDEIYLTNGYLEKEIDWIPGMEGIRLKDLPEFKNATKHAMVLITTTWKTLEWSLRITGKETNDNRHSLWKEEPECVEWLNSKEPNSVVYVNFGSLAVMSVQDLVEFGWGLVNSNCYFLWIIRPNLADGKPMVMPQELEVAMKEKGFVGGWCSQEEVLDHQAVGGFLTHCGWGSIMESLSAGVPMLGWPCLGEQGINCWQMRKQWQVGMEVGKDVKRDKVEKLVRMLMDGPDGERMRNKALVWKKTAEMATGSNGSSCLDVEKLTNEIIKLSRN